jgi:phytoene dehydrogenase-like protein
MDYEVVVVGAGVGGLTVAALLAARGASVCVVERESRGGGCATSFEKFGYNFEPTAGLYSDWGDDGVHARVFAELPVAPPEARKVAPAYTVRMTDAPDVRVGGEDAGEFDAELCAAFPECAAFAVDFYRELTRISDARRERARRLLRSPTRTPSRLRLIFGARHDAKEVEDSTLLDAAHAQTVADRLNGASPRFRRFVDAQLQLFALCASDECSLDTAAEVLTRARRATYTLRGGAGALADALTESIRRSGGTVRFDTTALRLADSNASAEGVVLLSGETVRATRAVVSNLTAWDTYGKLVGASRTNAVERARLKSLRGWGAYLVFLGLSEMAAARLPSTRIVALNNAGVGVSLDESPAFDPARDLFALNVAPAWDARAPVGRRAATLAAFADASEWFAYHETEEEHEAQDSRTLEFWWERLHAALPELGADVEVIETVTPRGYYEQTRRKLGAVWGAARTRDAVSADAFGYLTHLPNFFMVGDTTADANNVAAVTELALALADRIAPPRR